MSARDHLDAIVRDAVEAAPPPRTPEDVEPGLRDYYARNAEREGMSLRDYLARLASADGYADEDKAAEIAREIRRR